MEDHKPSDDENIYSNYASVWSNILLLLLLSINIFF